MKRRGFQVMHLEVLVSEDIGTTSSRRFSSVRGTGRILVAPQPVKQQVTHTSNQHGTASCFPFPIYNLQERHEPLDTSLV